MIDIDDFFDLLTEVCDELPDEFFRELHQGVVLSEETKISPYARDDDLVIMGEYRARATAIRSRYTMAPLTETGITAAASLLRTV